MSSRRVIATAVAANLFIVASATLLGVLTAGKPSRYFGEGRFTTAFSCAQLLAVAYLSSQMFVARRSFASRVGRVSAAWVWALIAAGFAFLAADEALEIHERLDHLIHRILRMRETAWTDRLDDAIIAIYGFIGLAILWLFRRELVFSRHIWRLLQAGFVCLFASVACDAVSNEDLFLGWLSGNAGTAKRLNNWFAAGDGAFTLLAEGFFLAAFYISHQAMRESPGMRVLSSMSRVDR